MSLDGLLAQVESTPGPDREMDFALYPLELAELADIIKHWTPEQREELIPRYTSSIDAALALVERKLPGWTYAIDASAPEAGIDVDLFAGRGRQGPADDVRGTGATPPLAILAALLRALISQEKSK